MQALAVLEYCTAGLTGKVFSGDRGGELPPYFEVYPFWDQEEAGELRRQYTIEKYRRVMERHAAWHIRRGGDHGGDS